MYSLFLKRCFFSYTFNLRIILRILLEHFYIAIGQIKWEKNIGIPPIPFTGVPFTTEGSTTYQCIYGPKRNKIKENGEEEEV